MFVKEITKRYDGKAVVDGVSFEIPKGKVLSLIGPNGAGKSTVMGMLSRLIARDSGLVDFEGTEITRWKSRELSKRLAILTQANNVQMKLTVRELVAFGRFPYSGGRLTQEDNEIIDRAIAYMELGDFEEQFIDELSGGQRQRCLMAMALAGEPKILLADEPTTALDVTVQAQILDLLRDIQQRLHTSTILVSHDLGVVARAADRVAIMYAGRIVEIGTAEEVYYDPRHPYTKGLLRSLPALAKRHGALHTIPGMPPTLIDPPEGDAFACRNPQALAIDYQQQPPMFPVSDTHYAATWLLDPRAPQLAPLPEGEEHYV